MSYWLWRIFLICLVLGTVQWAYTHPDSKLTLTAKKYWAQAQAEVDKLI
jgi:hypothetical protein